MCDSVFLAESVFSVISPPLCLLSTGFCHQILVLSFLSVGFHYQILLLALSACFHFLTQTLINPKITTTDRSDKDMSDFVINRRSCTSTCVTMMHVQEVIVLRPGGDWNKVMLWCGKGQLVFL